MEKGTRRTFPLSPSNASLTLYVCVRVCIYITVAHRKKAPTSGVNEAEPRVHS